MRSIIRARESDAASYAFVGEQPEGEEGRKEKRVELNVIKSEKGKYIRLEEDL